MALRETYRYPSSHAEVLAARPAIPDSCQSRATSSSDSRVCSSLKTYKIVLARASADPNLVLVLLILASGIAACGYYASQTLCNAKVGKIRSAYQGGFTVEDSASDNSGFSSITNEVRVMTTIDFCLTD
jgi:hypothetical protein